jgi:hypothetical protein
MRKRPILSSILFLVLAFSLSIFSYGQDKTLDQNDGGDWLKEADSAFNQAYWRGYIAGVMMGVGVARQEGAGGLDTALLLLEKEKGKEQLSKLIKNIKERVSNLEMFEISIGQVYEGMNIFYSDFANRRIKVIDAFFIVKMQIDGRDPDVIQAQIRYLRMPPATSEESTRIIEKAIQGKEEVTEEEDLKMGWFRDKNGISHTLFRYGHY